MSPLGSLARIVAARMRAEDGWTLMEMLVAIVLSSVVFATATALLSSIASLNGTTTREVAAQDVARTSIDGLGTQLRNATGPPGLDAVYYPAAGSSAATTELVFYNPAPAADTTNNTRGLRWVRYCLDYSTPASETLWMQTAAYDASQSAPPSTATCPSSAWATQQRVADNLVNKASTPNTPLFTPSLDASGRIHDIQVRLLVQGDSARKPTQIASSIDFRNQKSAPTATLSCQVQNKHAMCDASKSTDPDGEALSFKWKYRCCSPGYTGGDATWETNATNYLWDSGALTSGIYTVYVEVTDAGGLFTDATAQVTIP